MTDAPPTGPEQPPWLGLDTLGPLDPVVSEPTPPAEHGGIRDLPDEAALALEQARASKHGKGTRVLWMGPHQRLVIIALTAGTRLAEHTSPPAASFHVISGTARVYAAEPVGEGASEWVVEAGQVVAIPPQRHGVEAVTDCAALLTVSLDPHGSS